MPERATLLRAEEEARRIGRALKAAMPPGWGFTLLLLSYGEDGFATYLSSCDRADMIAALKELVKKLEADPAGMERIS